MRDFLRSDPFWRARRKGGLLIHFSQAIRMANSQNIFTVLFLYRFSQSSG
jgi:hypothetical protein